MIVLILITIPMQASSKTNGDILLEQVRITIPSRSNTFLNMTLEGNTGYYGSYFSTSGNVSFSIVRTSELDLFMQGVDTWLYQDSYQFQPCWEYPSYNQMNVTFVFESLSEESTELTFYIYQDTTDIVVNIDSTWISNYPPKLEFNTTFGGGLFDHAQGYLYLTGDNQSRGYFSFINNGTRFWTAGRWTEGRFDEYQDGEYELFLDVYDVFSEYTTRSFIFNKETNRTSFLVILTLGGVVALSFGIEYFRRRKYN